MNTLGIRANGLNLRHLHAVEKRNRAGSCRARDLNPSSRKRNLARIGCPKARNRPGPYRVPERWAVAVGAGAVATLWAGADCRTENPLARRLAACESRTLRSVLSRTTAITRWP